MTVSSQDRPWLTTAEAATIIGCDRKHVATLARTGKLRAERPSPKVLLFDRSEVERYAATAQRTGRPRGKRRTPVTDGADSEPANDSAVNNGPESL